VIGDRDPPHNNRTGANQVHEVMRQYHHLEGDSGVKTPS
jgi:hypothetical protein